MTVIRPSRRIIPVRGPHRHRVVAFAHLRPPTRTSQLNTPKSPGLQRPADSRRDTGEAPLPVNSNIAMHQPRQFDRSRPSTNVKSP